MTTAQTNVGSTQATRLEKAILAIYLDETTTPADVVPAYAAALALHGPGKGPWGTINAIVKERWTEGKLDSIKRRARQHLASYYPWCQAPAVKADDEHVLSARVGGAAVRIVVDIFDDLRDMDVLRDAMVGREAQAKLRANWTEMIAAELYKLTEDPAL